MTSSYHPLSCQCGALRGRVALNGVCNHVICFCKDCQAFARFLGRADEVLDAHGGSEVVQVTTDRVEITQGQNQLAAVRLSPKGLLRWYAACCRTPLGNTMPRGKLSFVGLLHSSLNGAPLEPSFGPVRGQFFSASALGEPRPADRGLLPMVCRLLGMAVAARLSGRYRRTPFFTETKAPVVEPELLCADERERLRRGA